jgi:hypothetical protein
MKYYRAYLLIFLYLTAAFRTVIPVWKDTADHFFYEVEHYATVHQTKGHDHVHDEVKKATEDQQESGKRTAVSTEQVSAHWPVFIHCSVQVFPVLLRKYQQVASALSTTFISKHIPPPKQLSSY